MCLCHNLYHKLICSIVVTFTFFVPYVHAEPMTPHELHSPSETVGDITYKRAKLASLKVDIELQDALNKLNELSSPIPLSMPIPIQNSTQSLLESLEVPTNSTSKKEFLQDTNSKISRLISIQSVDDGQFVANLRSQKGNIVTVKSGQRFEGGIVEITREGVRIKKGSSSILLGLE